jgi:hypothetical protein
MSSNWIMFVKKFARENGLTYGEALSMASPYYRKAMGTYPTRKSHRRKRGRGGVLLGGYYSSTSYPY